MLDLFRFLLALLGLTLGFALGWRLGGWLDEAWSRRRRRHAARRRS